MPAAVPAIAAFAATAAATTAGWAFIAGSVAITASLVGAGVGLAASLGMSALMGKPKGPDLGSLFNSPGGGRTFQFRQPTPPRQVVLGRIKVSGPVMFMHSAPDDTGREDGYFYLQLALAGHECRAIESIYINDEISTDAKYTGFVTVGKNLGRSDQVEDALFLSDLGAIFTDHWLRGVCNIAARLKGNATAFPNGLPNLSAVVWGVNQVYDPRLGTRADVAAYRWSNNAALCYAFWKMWGQGMKIPYEDIDEDTLIDSANVCDERIRVFGSTTTFSVNLSVNSITLAESGRSLDVGDGVRVSTSGTLPAPLVAGTTYYISPADGGAFRLATTVSNAIDGVAVLITTTGTGTQTLTYWDEARYKLNGSFTLDQDKGSIQEQLLSAMMGFDVEIGGKWFIHAAAPTTPTRTINEDDLLGNMTSLPKRSMRDRFNGVRARFVNPDKFWQPDDAPPLLVQGYVDEDNGVALYEDANFPFITSGRQVQRCMKIHLERNRRQRTVSFQGMYNCIPIRPLMGVYIDWDRYGWEQRETICMGWKLTEQLGVELALQDHDNAIYDWDHETDERLFAIPQGVTLPDPSAITAPASVTVVTPTTPTYTQLSIEWSEVSTIWLDGYDVEYRDAGGTDWTGYGRVGGREDTSLTASVERATPQDFQVRAVTRNGTPSAFTQNLAPSEPTAVSATGGTNEIELEWTNGAGAAEVQIFESNSASTVGATLLTTVAVTASPQTHTRTGLGAAETKHYTLRSVNADGNISVLTAFVNATTD